MLAYGVIQQLANIKAVMNSTININNITKSFTILELKIASPQQSHMSYLAIYG